jgi:hypothetical protein
VLADFVCSGPAAAQFLTFVSSTGNDANSCLVQTAPCKTLQRGINATSPGGELRVLSQLTSNGYVNRSMTIDAEGHTIIGTLIVENASATVAFRNIVLTGRDAYGYGFDIRAAAAVHIENCTVERFVGNGIDLTANTELFVSQSILRDNGLAGFATGPTTSKVTIDNSLFENNSVNGVSVNGGEVSISNSISTGNFKGFTFSSGEVNVLESTAANNTTGFEVSGGRLTLKSSTSRSNLSGSVGLRVEDGAEVRISKSTIVNNLVGVSNGGTVYSLGDNVIDDNATDVTGTAIDTTTVNPL